MAKLTPKQQQASGLSNHILVTANAGSGKTKVLSGRYIDALLNKNIRVNEIAAISFTDKAASELYSKIREQLVEKYNDSKDDNEKIKLNGLIKDLVNSNISTFHSFCSSLLKEYPLEVGLDPSFKLLDDQSSDNVIKETTDEIISRSLADEELSPGIKKLIRLLRGTSGFKSALRKMVKERKRVESWLDGLDGEISSEAIFKRSVETINNYIAVLFPTLDKTVEDIAYINDIVASKGENDVANTISDLLSQFHATTDNIVKFETITQILNIFIGDKGNIKFQGYLNKNLKSLVDPEKLAAIQDNCRYFWNLFGLKNKIPLEKSYPHLTIYSEYSFLFIRFYKITLELLNKKKKDLNAIDFEDLLILTSELLRKDSVRKAIQGRYKFMMIDEYQDTNDLQFDIFIPLLGDLSTGNLYVVGDKKQSIYGFRDADLTVFDRTKEKIVSNSGESVVLEHTFRLTRELTAFVNKIFPRVFFDRNERLDGTAEQFTKKRKLLNAVDYDQTVFFDLNKDYKESEITLLLTDMSKNSCISTDDGGQTNPASSGKNNSVNIKQTRQAEARMLAAHLSKHFAHISELNKSLKEKLTVAILARKSSYFEFLEEALTEAGVPYELMGGKKFYQQKVVEDISMIFNFLTDPGNDFNLYSLLRSPFFSISDEDILFISQSEGNTAFEKLGFIKRETNNRLTVAHDTLTSLLEFSQGSKPHKIIDHVLSNTPYLAIVSKRPNGNQILANINKLLSQAVEFENSSFNSIYDYKSILQRLMKEIEKESQAPLSGEIDTVKIMTIHQSKGLEFNSVYIFGCAESALLEGSWNKSPVSIHKDLGLKFKISESDDIFNDNISHVHDKLTDLIDKQVEIEELKRVFYVAVTRAANNLFLSVSMKDDKVVENSFLQMLLKGLDIPFPPSEDFDLEAGTLTTARNGEDGQIVSSDEQITLKIKVCSDLAPKTVHMIPGISAHPAHEFSVHPNKLEKKLSNEIITATKFLSFLQCPFKYYLSYISGITGIPGLADFIAEDTDPEVAEEDLLQDIVLDNTENGAVKSGEINLGAAVGTIVHEVLSKTGKPELNKDLVSSVVNQFLSDNPEFSAEKEALKKITSDKLKNFFKNSVASEIFSQTNFDNEREIFVQVDDFYLVGVIDKLIILDNKIVIIDYKTDKNPDASLARYVDQLKYYAFLCSRIFPEVELFELRLIFLGNPEFFDPLTVNKNEINITGKRIREFVGTLRTAINSNGFQKNTSHCPDCRFSFNSEKCFV